MTMRAQSSLLTLLIKNSTVNHALQAKHDVTVTFATFYFSDISCRSKDTFSTGLVVAAQQVVFALAQNVSSLYG